MTEEEFKKAYEKEKADWDKAVIMGEVKGEFPTFEEYVEGTGVFL